MFRVLFVSLMILNMSVPLFSQDAIEPKLEPKSAVLDKIKMLKSNEACLLPKPTIIENMGDFAKGWHYMKEFGPEGRDYSLKMVWMPDRKRSFFCGANHQSPHRFNDAWEYDLASNTWVCLYNPDYNDVLPLPAYAKDTLVVKDGWLRTKNGGPGHPAHTWSGITYDPNQKAIVWNCFWPNYRLEQKLNLFGLKEADLFKGPKVWLFYPQTKKWEPLQTVEPWPKEKYGYSLEYCPELKKPVYHYGNSAFTLDVEKKTWAEKTSEGDGYRMETILCYDSKRKQFLAHYGPLANSKNKITLTAKVVGGEIQPWKKVLESENAPTGMDHLSMFQFDPKSGDGFIFENETKSLWRFNPDTNAWTKIDSLGDKIDKESYGGKLISYFDPERNVFVVLGKGWVWCYRP